MLLNTHLNWKDFQVENVKKEDLDCSVFGHMSCPVCGSKLYGHGWRKRYIEKESEVFILIWVHRKRCPSCGKTFTIVLDGMASVFQYPLRRMKEFFLSYLEKEHCSASLRIPIPTQKLWWKNLMSRTRAELGMFPSKAEITKAIEAIHPFSAHPSSHLVFTKRADARSFFSQGTKSYHRMHLLLYAGPL